MFSILGARQKKRIVDEQALLSQANTCERFSYTSIMAATAHFLSIYMQVDAKHKIAMMDADAEPTDIDNYNGADITCAHMDINDKGIDYIKHWLSGLDMSLEEMDYTMDDDDFHSIMMDLDFDEMDFDTDSTDTDMDDTTDDGASVFDTMDTDTTADTTDTESIDTDMDDTTDTKPPDKNMEIYDDDAVMDDTSRKLDDIEMVD